MQRLFETLTSPDNLFSAWQQVKAKGSAGGIDNVSIGMFDTRSGDHLERLRLEILEERYIPEPYKTFSIPKNEDEFRTLGLPTVRDKIVQNATRSLIEPLFEKQFLNCSYGYRPGKGAVRAIRRVQHRISGEHYEWIVLADIDNFFDTIDPEILFRLLQETIQCTQTMRLIRLWVQIGAVNFRLKYIPYNEGIPQGSVLSPLFSNVYLHPFDQFLVGAGYAPVRYADDFVIFAKTQQQAQKAFTEARHFLGETLKLTLNKEYSIRKTATGFEYLHILFRNGQIGITAERHAHLTEKVSKVFGDGKHLPDRENLIRKLGGILNYYGQLLPEPTMVALDDHLKVMLSGLGATMIKQKKMTRQAFQTWLEKVPFLSRPSITDLQSAIRSVMEKTRQLLAVEKKSQTGEEAEKQIRSDIERKRRQYEEMADAGREIMVSTPGVFIGLTQKGVTLRENGKVRSVVKTHNLQNITVMAAGVSLSEPLIRHCAEERIPIDFIGFNGLPYARLFSPLYPDATIGMAQLRALENGRGIEAVKEMVCGKLRNQLALIKYYYKYRKDTDPDYAEAFSHHTSTISQAIEKIRKLEDPALETVRASVMGLEGTAAAAYWDMIVRLLNNYTFFAGRERQGATDQVNSLLNYGYGVLYSRIWEAVIRERLNPHISYLHVPVDSKPTLAFDLIEEFRQQVVDRSVIALITKGEEIEMEKGQLSPATRKRLVEKILERLNNREKFRGREMRTGEIIRHQARALVRHLKGEKRYKAYIGKW